MKGKDVCVHTMKGKDVCVHMMKGKDVCVYMMKGKDICVHMMKAYGGGEVYKMKFKIKHNIKSKEKFTIQYSTLYK
jgi:hypothetical protein